MEDVELQVFNHVLDKIWTKAFGVVAKDWSIANCRILEAKICEIVGEDVIECRSIQRFVDVLIDQKRITNGRTKRVLLYYLANKSMQADQGPDEAWIVEYINEIYQSLDATPIQKEKTNSSLNFYAGEYIIHYRSPRFSKFEIFDDASIIIYEDGSAIFISGVESFQGIVEKKIDHLYLSFSNDHENIYVIIKIGISLQPKYLKVLTGIVSGVMNQLDFPYGTTVVFIKNDSTVIEDEQERVQEIFNYIGDKYKVEIDQNILKMLDTDYTIKSIISKKETHQLLGTWFAYTISADKSKLFHSKLTILDTNRVEYEGSHSSYKGFIRYEGDNVFINLEGRKLGFISARVGYRDWSKIDEFSGTFSTITTESGQPSMGIIFFQRANSSDFIPAAYNAESEEYISRMDIVKRISTVLLP
jgi:hypothetical protein